MEYTFRAVIIGGGAAGHAAAISWAKKLGGSQVAIVEKQSKTGRKLLASGNGRCNISNENADAGHYHGDSTIIDSVLSRFSVSSLKTFFEETGVLLRADSEGRLYPYSNQAVTILSALHRTCCRLGVREILSFAVRSLKKENGQFILTSDEDTIRCQFLIAACGSQAAPQLGADDSGYRLLKGFGMEPTPLFPALAPVSAAEKRRSLKGVRAKGSAVLLKDGKPFRRTAGEIQFTDSGLSGICIFELARCVNEYFTLGTIGGTPCGRIQIALDLLPDLSFQEAYNFWERSRSIFGKDSTASLLAGVLPQKLAEEIVRSCGLTEKNCGSLTARDLKLLTSTAKRFLFTPNGRSDFGSAQVSAGGFDSRQVDPYTLMSRKVKNLFLCGEILDVDGDCGGYNLHFAVGSGWLTAFPDYH